MDKQHEARGNSGEANNNPRHHTRFKLIMLGEMPPKSENAYDDAGG